MLSVSTTWNYARHGALTPNDLRDSLGLDPYPEEFTFADRPLPVALLDLQLGARQADGEKSATRLLDELLELRKDLAARLERRQTPSLGGRDERVRGV